MPAACAPSSKTRSRATERIYQVVSLHGARRRCDLQLRSADHRTKQRARRVADRALERSVGANVPASANSDSARSAQAGEQIALAPRILRRAPPTNCTKPSRTSRRRTTSRCARRRPIRSPTCSTARAINGRQRFAPRKSQRKRIEAADDEAGIHNAATLRSAAEIELAGAMNAGTQRAEQRALYASADRRLAEAAEFFRDARVAGTRAVRDQHARRAGRDHRRLRRSSNAAGAFGRNGPSQQRRRRAGEITRQPRGRAHLSRIHCAGRKGIRGVAAAHRSADPALSIRGTAGQLRFHVDCPRRFRPGPDLAHRGTQALHRGSASRPSAPSNWPRWAASICAWETPSARSRPCGLRSSNRSASRTTADWLSTLRVAANAASMLGQHDTAIGYLRKSTQIDANPHGVARTRVLIAAELRAAGKLVEAEAELSEPHEISQCPGTRGSARRTRASAPRPEPARRRDRRSACRGPSVRRARPGIQSHRHEYGAFAGVARQTGRDGRGGRGRRGHCDRDAHPREFRESGMACAFSFRAVRPLRGAHCRGPCPCGRRRHVACIPSPPKTCAADRSPTSLH